MVHVIWFCCLPVTFRGVTRISASGQRVSSRPIAGVCHLAAQFGDACKRIVVQSVLVKMFMNVHEGQHKDPIKHRLASVCELLMMQCLTAQSIR